uniref:Uncharacterized protein n=1 Tax=Ditylenchus dipsaci TaxID=166011 RepID=A0A915EM55_9BILA
MRPPQRTHQHIQSLKGNRKREPWKPIDCWRDRLIGAVCVPTPLLCLSGAAADGVCVSANNYHCYFL